MQFYSYVQLMGFATRKLIDHYRDRPQFEEFKPDIIFGHSASDGMSRHVGDECGIDPQLYRLNHQHYANTFSASVPVTMSQSLSSGALSDGDHVLLLLASSGVTTAVTKFVFHT